MQRLPSFTIIATPRTKKTSSVLIPKKGSPRCSVCGQYKEHLIIPSRQHEEWFQTAMWEAPRIKRQLTENGITLPISELVGVQALFYREKNIGDLCGFLQSLGDLLQEPVIRKGKVRRSGMGIILDDRQIASWDGSRRLIDPKNPRVEVTITILPGGQIDIPLEEEEEF